MHRIGYVKVFSQRLNFSLFSRSLHINKLIENDLLVISDEIRYSNKPVVALESTIITHGLPYPTNLNTALEVENEIRKLDVVPATIALLDGKLRVGLTRDQIETVAKGHKEAVKLSRRDLPYALATPNLIGGTTVSATCIAAHAAGIPIFCTGGIGGVHRDFADSMDVSADLSELSRTPTAVVSSGVKSILDIGKTLEYLETLGVGVYTLDKTGSKDFPAFFTSKSGFYSAYNCGSEAEAAKVIHANLKTGLNTGLLVGVPIPHEHSVDPQIIEAAINQALLDANRLKIKGKKVTPFLLERINQITHGKSLASNVALIKNNARTSAKIAIELHKLNNPSKFSSNSKSSSNRQVTVIGGINLDNCYKLADEKTINLKGVTQPCEFYQALGGVGRNMAEALIRLGVPKSFLISSVSNDLAGSFIKHESSKIGLDTSKWLIIDESKCSTGSYNAVFDMNGELLIGCGDMRAHDHLTPDELEKHLDTVKSSSLCVLDADLPVESIKFVCEYCSKLNIPVWFNPTDLRKAARVIEADSLMKITYMSPNLKELFTIFKSSIETGLNSLTDDEKMNFAKLVGKYEGNLNEGLGEMESNELNLILKYLLRFVPFIFLSRGEKEMLLASRFDLELSSMLPVKETLCELDGKVSEPCLFKFPVVELEGDEKVVNVTGAGDSASSGIIAGCAKGYSLIDSVYYGLIAAKYALMTQKNVSHQLSQIHLDQVKNTARKYFSKINKIKL